MRTHPSFPPWPTVPLLALTACAQTLDLLPPEPEATTSPGGAAGADAGGGDAGGSGGAGGSPVVHVEPYCAGLACGTPCLCDVEPCFAMAGDFVCDSVGTCQPEQLVSCPEYSPCEDHACGDACTPCDPTQPGCNPVGEHFCNGDGFCKTVQESCP